MWSLPDVLMVHLKRFTNSRFSRDKVKTSILLEPRCFFLGHDLCAFSLCICDIY